MAYSEQDIKEKIVELLEEINERYGLLEEKLKPEHHSEILLLAAQAQYLGAHLSALAARLQIPQPGESAVADPTTQNETLFFTPAVDHGRNEVDDQPTEQEIPEGDNPQETVSADHQEEENLDAGRLEEIEVPQQEEGSKEDLPEGEHPEEAAEDETDTVHESRDRNVEARQMEPTSRPYVGTGRPQHTEDSGFTQTKANIDSERTNQSDQHQKPAEASVSREKEDVSTAAKTEPIVNEVIIEEKSIEIQDRPEQKPTPSEITPPAVPQSRRPMTINEMIQQQKKAGLTNVNQFNTSVERGTDRNVDLKTAVSLNDKLLFIKDLFNGYSLAYSEAVELLNRFDNFAEADAFLQSNYALKNNWSGKPQTVDKLYSILRKKYG